MTEYPADIKQTYTGEEMKKMTVAKLRSLARELKITNMTPQEIRFAKKQDLIDAILKFTEKRGRLCSYMTKTFCQYRKCASW